jgi:hypothetical protein
MKECNSFDSCFIHRTFGLLLGTKCPHPLPNSGHRYSHVDSAKSYAAQSGLNMLTFASPQLTVNSNSIVVA